MSGLVPVRTWAPTASGSGRDALGIREQQHPPSQVAQGRAADVKNSAAVAVSELVTAALEQKHRSARKCSTLPPSGSVDLPRVKSYRAPKRRRRQPGAVLSVPIQPLVTCPVCAGLIVTHSLCGRSWETRCQRYVLLLFKTRVPPLTSNLLKMARQMARLVMWIQFPLMVRGLIWCVINLHSPR